MAVSNLKNYINKDKLILLIGNNKTSEKQIVSMIPKIKRICKHKKLVLDFKVNKNTKLSPLLNNLKQVINTKNEEHKLNLIYDYTCNF
jgi:ferritin-like metal-binding protein YciE